MKLLGKKVNGWLCQNSSHFFVGDTVLYNFPVKAAHIDLYMWWDHVQNACQTTSLGIHTIRPKDMNMSRNVYEKTWTSWRLKSPAIFVFLQQLVQANVQEDIIIQYYCPFVDKSTMLGGFPWQGNNNAENVSMPSRHHGVTWNVSNSMATLAGRNQAPVWGGEGPQIAKFMGPTWGPPGSRRPQMGPMLAPWTMLTKALCMQDMWLASSWYCTVPYPSFPRALPKPPRNMSKTAKPIIV